MQTLLWLDDTRDPLKGDWLVFSPIDRPFEVVWAKSYYGFVEHISEHGLPTAVCFDHDLGDTSEPEMTGYSCAKWLVEYCMDNNLPLPKCNVQSSNSVGKDNINGLLLGFLKNH